MLLYGDVGDPWGYGDGFTPSDVAMGLAEHGAGDITVRLNSGGGSAFDGMAIHSLLKTHAGKVTIAIDGVAASAASLIAMGGDRIEIRKGAMLMIHDPSMITMGTEDDHRASAELLGKLAGSYASFMPTARRKTPDAAREIMRAETWLSSDDAVKEGFADGDRCPEGRAAACSITGLRARAGRACPCGRALWGRRAWRPSRRFCEHDQNDRGGPPL
jgi:ATP-dependent protease ClpP protease subunit